MAVQNVRGRDHKCCDPHIISLPLVNQIKEQVFKRRIQYMQDNITYNSYTSHHTVKHATNPTTDYMFTYHSAATHEACHNYTPVTQHTIPLHDAPHNTPVTHITRHIHT